jgi:Membrane carboxypeptidase/penicillin-binding protein
VSIGTKPASRARGGKHAPRKEPKKKGFFRRFWWVFVLVPVLGVASVAGALMYAYSKIELPKTLPPIQSTYIYDRDGNLLTTLHGVVDRTIVPLSRISKSAQNAVIAVEDHGFYSHLGVDPIGIVRAAWTDLIKHQTVQGGSTITQQLVKNVYAGHYVKNPDGSTDYVVPPRTIGQKIREGLLAVKLEKSFTKEQILAK